MNAQQRAMMIEAINEDCAIRFVYRDGLGGSCAIGGMAIKAGLADALPDVEDYASNHWNIGEVDHRLIEGLKMSYGLDLEELSNIQHLNDQFETPEERREAILDFIATTG